MPDEEQKEDFVKIVVDLPEPDMGTGGEGLWTVQVGPDLYEVRNSPWHARNINWGDVVRAVPTNEGRNRSLSRSLRGVAIGPFMCTTYLKTDKLERMSS